MSSRLSRMRLALLEWNALFRQCGIYSSKGSLYEPVDAAMSSITVR